MFVIAELTQAEGFLPLHAGHSAIDDFGIMPKGQHKHRVIILYDRERRRTCSICCSFLTGDEGWLKRPRRRVDCSSYDDVTRGVLDSRAEPRRADEAF